MAINAPRKEKSLVISLHIDEKNHNIFVKTSVKSFVKTLSLNVKYSPPMTLKQPSCWSMILKKYLINILWIFQSTCCPAYFGNLHNFSVQDFFKFHPGEKYFLIFFLFNTAWKMSKHRVFFWSVFSRIRTEYRDFLRICPHLVRMRENTDQKKLHICKQTL